MKSPILTNDAAREAIDQILESFNKTGKYGDGPNVAGYFHDANGFTAFDNTTGDCWTEDGFANEAAAERWINNEI